MSGLRMQGTQKLPAALVPICSIVIFVAFGVSLEIKAHSSAIGWVFVPIVALSPHKASVGTL